MLQDQLTCSSIDHKSCGVAENVPPVAPVVVSVVVPVVQNVPPLTVAVGWVDIVTEK
jgi:hypothetical protein